LNGGINVTKVGEIYLCEICGNKVKVLEAGKGKLVCCGQEMKRLWCFNWIFHFLDRNRFRKYV